MSNSTITIFVVQGVYYEFDDDRRWWEGWTSSKDEAEAHAALLQQEFANYTVWRDSLPEPDYNACETDEAYEIVWKAHVKLFEDYSAHGEFPCHPHDTGQVNYRVLEVHRIGERL